MIMSDDKGLSHTGLAIVWLLLLIVTWLPPLVLAFQKTVLEDDDTGAVLAVFPPGSSASENLERIIRARGAFVSRVVTDQAWIVYSFEAGFVKRMKDRGVWMVFDPLLLDPLALLGCSSASRRH